MAGVAVPDQIALADLGETLSSLRLCSDAAERAMRRSLSERGQLTPLLCYRTSSSLEVFDGFKRLRAARALGWPSLRVERIATDATEAKLSLWQVNEGHGLSEIEEAWLLRALHRDDGLPQHEIARRLGRHKSWVSRRVMLAECLTVEVEAQVRLGLLSATAARELCRLPRGNQDETAHAVMHRGLTTRQTTTLVESLLGAHVGGPLLGSTVAISGALLLVFASNTGLLKGREMLIALFRLRRGIGRGQYVFFLIGQQVPAFLANADDATDLFTRF